MDGKASDWRPGPTVCRCCLTEGCYKDISTEYFWMGKREVYAEMLKETLDVTIAYSQSGGPNSNSRLICEPCISRLRDATEFKRQVIDCEKTFMHHLDGGSASGSHEVQVDTIGEVKVELVKREKESLSDDDFDDRPGFLDVDDDDDDDDLDDQPLTKLASKVPKKEAVDLLDLLDNSQITVKRKPTVKMKEPPAKKVKKKEIVSKPSASKVAAMKKNEKKKESGISLITAAKCNAENIVRHATVYPFRIPEDSMVCVYCCEDYDDPITFRKHMDVAHQTFSVRIAFRHCLESYLKCDCSDIRCRICSESCESLEEVAIHLQQEHDIPMNLSAPMGIQPFKPDKLRCAICEYNAFSLRRLSRHTQIHFRRFTCESCGKSYTTNTALRAHIKHTHMVNSKAHYCIRCNTLFESPDARRKHLQEVSKCWPYVCSQCGERFIAINPKKRHMREVHGVKQNCHTCPECGKVFAGREACQKHFKMAHTDDHYVCSTCGKKFVKKGRLERHVRIHTGEKPYSCCVCTKSFSQKSALSQHMWLHSAQKRFECKTCNKTFNQKVFWTTHNKTMHPELEIMGDYESD